MPFPTAYPVDALSHIMDKNDSLYCRLECAYDLGGFAAGQLLPDDGSHPHPVFAAHPCPDNEDDCCKELEAALAPPKGAAAGAVDIAAVNWVFVIALLKKLLELWGV